MILNYLIENLLPILIALSGAIAWITEKKKRKAEIDSVVVTNKQGEATALQGMQSVYDKFVEDVKTQINELRAENTNLQTEIAEVKKQAEKERKELTSNVAELRAENAALRTEIAEVKKQAEKERKELTSEVNDLKEKNMALMAEIEKYVKELKLYRKETKK